VVEVLHPLGVVDLGMALGLVPPVEIETLFGDRGWLKAHPNILVKPFKATLGLGRPQGPAVEPQGNAKTAKETAVPVETHATAPEALGKEVLVELG